MVQEAVRNVVSTRRPGPFRSASGRTASCAWVEVTDDGVGFDSSLAEARDSEGHLGLPGIKGLVADAGGRLEVDTAPGAGTTVRVEVPMR